MTLLSCNDLTPTEQRLYIAAAEGQLLDLTTGQADDDNPARAHQWNPDRSIRAPLLQQLLTASTTGLQPGVAAR
jgi:hypothetical protein